MYKNTGKRHTQAAHKLKKLNRSMTQTEVRLLFPGCDIDEIYISLPRF